MLEELENFTQELWDAILISLLSLNVDTKDQNEMMHGLTHQIYPSGEQRWFWKGKEIVKVEKSSLGYKVIQCL